MRNLLREKGYKSTPARLAILDIFSKSRVPLNAETIYKKLKSLGTVKGINEVTVYRTLSSLSESGILRRVDIRKDSVHFELAAEHHHHIVCTNCDTVEDFQNRNIEKFLEKIIGRSSKFINITEHSLELFGLCRRCA